MRVNVLGPIRHRLLEKLDFRSVPYRYYKLGYVKRGSIAFRVQKDGCGIPSSARALLVPEGL